MRLARRGSAGQERPAVWDGEHWRDISTLTPSVGPELLDTWAQIDRLLASGQAPRVADDERFGPPLSRIGKIVCVGLNYRDHARETGADEPAEPILFLKAADTVVGPDDDVLVPRGSAKTDWEVELGVVIGRRTAYLDDPADAPQVIAGYVISHDVSEREFQLERGGQWDKGKNCATFNPMGPWFVTADEVEDVQSLGLRLWVNGELRQDGNTRDMIFSVRHLVWYVSQYLTLYPGDVINTGTPAGVALGRPDACYLQAGDEVVLEIDGLGRQRQRIGRA